MKHEIGTREGGRDWGFPYTPVLDDYGLDPYEMRVYLRLSRRAGMGGQCWESIAKIAQACKMSQQKVKDSLNLLADAQLIRKVKRPGKSDIYELMSDAHWVDAKYLDALRKDISSYREKSDQRRKNLYQQLASYDVADYLVANTELRGSQPPNYDVVNTELRGSYKDLMNTQEVITPEALPSKGKKERCENSQEFPEFKQQTAPSLIAKANANARTDIPHESKGSAAACDNSAFMGYGNIAPDGKTRPFNQMTGKWASVSSDPWMQGVNPTKEFKQWVYLQAIAEGKSYRESTAAGEIRNNYQRAGDLWEEYQQSQQLQQPSLTSRYAITTEAPPSLTPLVERDPEARRVMEETLANLKKKAAEQNASQSAAKRHPR